MTSSPCDVTTTVISPSPLPTATRRRGERSNYSSGCISTIDVVGVTSSPPELQREPRAITIRRTNLQSVSFSNRQRAPALSVSNDVDSKRDSSLLRRSSTKRHRIRRYMHYLEMQIGAVSLTLTLNLNCKPQP